MNTELIKKIRRKIRSLKIIPNMLGLLYRKKFYSKHINEVVNTEDITLAKDNFLALIDNKEFFKDIKEGLPGINFNPDKFLYLKYNKNNNICQLCIFTIAPKRNIFSKIESYFFNEVKSKDTSLYVIYNSSVVFKSEDPLDDIEFHQNRYAGKKITLSPIPYELNEKEVEEYLEGLADADEWLVSTDKKGEDYMTKREKTKRREKDIKDLAPPTYIQPESNINNMYISDFIFDTISLAKLGVWVEEIEQLIISEINFDKKIYASIQEKKMRNVKKALEERTRKELKNVRDAEKDFDIGPYK